MELSVVSIDYQSCNQLEERSKFGIVDCELFKIKTVLLTFVI
jgi:hypothetical protein